MDSREQNKITPAGRIYKLDECRQLGFFPIYRIAQNCYFAQLFLISILPLQLLLQELPRDPIYYENRANLPL